MEEATAVREATAIRVGATAKVEEEEAAPLEDLVNTCGLSYLQRWDFQLLKLIKTCNAQVLVPEDPVPAYLYMLPIFIMAENHLRNNISGGGYNYRYSSSSGNSQQYPGSDQV